MNWPGPGGTNQVRMQLGLANGSTATLVTNGAWALNRFFDKARTSCSGSSQGYSSYGCPCGYGHEKRGSWNGLRMLFGANSSVT